MKLWLRKSKKDEKIEKINIIDRKVTIKVN